MSNEMIQDTTSHSDLNVFISQALSVNENILKHLETYKQNKLIKRESIEALDAEVTLALAEARAQNIKEIVTTNITELARVMNSIDQMEADGKLKGAKLLSAYGQLEKLNEELRHNLQVYYNRAIDEEKAAEHRSSALPLFIPENSTDLIHLSDALSKVMKNMSVEVDSLPASLHPAVSAFMSMNTQEKSDYITRLNEAVVAANYKENRNIDFKSYSKKMKGIYTNSFLADKLNFERTIMVNKEKAEETINDIKIISQQDTVSVTTNSIDLPQQHADGGKSLSNSQVKENESFEEARKRFMRSVQKAGIQQEVRMKEHYVSPTLKRMQKSMATRKHKRRGK